MFSLINKKRNNMPVIGLNFLRAAIMSHCNLCLRDIFLGFFLLFNVFYSIREAKQDLGKPVAVGMALL